MISPFCRTLPTLKRVDGKELSRLRVLTQRYDNFCHFVDDSRCFIARTMYFRRTNKRAKHGDCTALLNAFDVFWAHDTFEIRQIKMRFGYIAEYIDSAENL